MFSRCNILTNLRDTAGRAQNTATLDAKQSSGLVGIQANNHPESLALMDHVVVQLVMSALMVIVARNM
jgi:hypothetical protein